MANKTLYVGNLSYSVTETELAQHFASHGASQARIIEGRGFGFLDIPADNLQTAISEKHNTDLGGRTITVSEARPKGESDNRSGGYSNSGGGGGGGRSRSW
jgi:RNA recognition motif-containing protein